MIRGKTDLYFFFFFCKELCKYAQKKQLLAGRSHFCKPFTSFVFSSREQDRKLFLFLSFVSLEVKLKPLLVAAPLLKPINLLVCSLVSVLLTSPGCGKSGEYTVLCLGYPRTYDVTRDCGPS